MKILIIEDNPVNLKLACDFLRNTTHKLLTAREAEEGIKLAGEQLPDLILMDIRLPHIDGLSATKALKTNPRTRHIKIVAVTAYAMKGDKEKILAAGCDGYLAKPFLHKEFLEVIKSFESELEESAAMSSPHTTSPGPDQTKIG